MKIVLSKKHQIWIHAIILCCSSFALSSCSPKDPYTRYLKSPCVASSKSGTGDADPCIRRDTEGKQMYMEYMKSLG